MATYTTAQMLAAGVNPASTDCASFPGPVVLEYYLDASKKATVATDIITFFDIPAYTGMIITGAALRSLKLAPLRSRLTLVSRVRISPV